MKPKYNILQNVVTPKGDGIIRELILNQNETYKYYIWLYGMREYKWFPESVINKPNSKQPKFKVGDRVKIDWDNLPFQKYDDFRDVGDIREIDEYKIHINHFSIFNPSWFISVDIELDSQYLTLVESKPECKFLKGQEVNAHDFIIQESFFKTATIVTYNGIISSIEDEIVTVDELASCGWQIQISIEEANKYLKYPEKKKEKWSVGTYVEMLPSHVVYKSLIDVYQNAYFEITHYNKKDHHITIKHSNMDVEYAYSIDTIEFSNDWIWHENKPEKETNKQIINKLVAKNIEESTKYPLRKPEIKNELYERYGKSPIEGLWKIMNREGHKFTWSESDAVSQFYYGGCDTVKEDAMMSCIYFNRMYPMTPDECFPNILSKPAITISKQKKINININKQKI